MGEEVTGVHAVASNLDLASVLDISKVLDLLAMPLVNRTARKRHDWSPEQLVPSEIGMCGLALVPCAKQIGALDTTDQVTMVTTATNKDCQLGVLERAGKP